MEVNEDDDRSECIGEGLADAIYNLELQFLESIKVINDP